MKFISSYIFRSMCSLLVGLLLLFNAEQMPVLIVKANGNYEKYTLDELLPTAFGGAYLHR